MWISIGLALSVWLFIVAALLFVALVIARWLDQARAGVQTEVKGAQRRLESLRSGRRRPGGPAGRRT